MVDLSYEAFLISNYGRIPNVVCPSCDSGAYISWQVAMNEKEIARLEAEEAEEKQKAETYIIEEVKVKEKKNKN
jgi:hypothetical protein